MRTLSATLLAAQRQASRLPYVRLETFDRVAGVARLHFQRLYTGSEPDYFHAATMPGDGSLVRSRLDPVTYTLYLQRVASPGPGADFSAWTSAGTSSAGAGLALCSQGANVLLFYVGVDQHTVYCRESTDYGATFSTATALIVALDPVTWMAAAISPSVVVGLFYVSGATIWVTLRTGGTWGSPGVWPHSLNALSGLAVAYSGDWDLALAGQDTSGYRKVWTCIYGDGGAEPVGTWSALREIARASAGSQVSFRATSLASADVFRLFFVEKYAGTQSYQRPQWSHSLASASFEDNLWREPVPFDLDADYGVALVAGEDYAWLCCPSGVWRAPRASASQELTAALLRAVA